ncbi:hypothetical protein CC86DRAFT_428571 [Ophiobolus disseminans]|uniref:Uncharacterized protein n=1 Tax=Ophiobolus disseminans TaxID=1469910 RepID=A0A6A6ZK61_9PLEO|nr:hypothetical protein CC86DRAFT_428571 [Ophiobolus disseminans]
MVKHNFDLPELWGKYYVEGMKSGSISKMRNIMNGYVDKEGHHCPVCNAAMKPDCIKELHMVFCLVLVSDSDGKGGLQASICGNRFPPKSPKGCGIHPYSEGHNACIKAAWKGEDHQMPNWLPHWAPGFVYVESGPRSKKRAKKLEKATEDEPFKSTAKGIMRSTRAVNELNKMIFSTDVPAMPSPESMEAALMLAKMGAMALNGTTNLGQAGRPKMKIELTSEEKRAPDNWRIYEDRKQEQLALENQRAALKKAIAKEDKDLEEMATHTKRGKGRRKQSFALPASAISRRNH